MSTPADPLTAVVHVWRVPSPAAGLARVARDRLRPERGGASFARLLGSSGPGFGRRDGDLRQWVLLTCWPSGPGAGAAADELPVVGAMDAVATERARLVLRPLQARGRWGGAEPFGGPAPGTEPDGPVAAITRATVRPGAARAFRGLVPAVAAELAAAPGLRVAIGVGERPWGLLGTLSVWDDLAAMRAFAHRAPAHADVARRSRTGRWFAEELFARFAVEAAQGSVRGVALPAGDGPPT